MVGKKCGVYYTKQILDYQLLDMSHKNICDSSSYDNKKDDGVCNDDAFACKPLYDAADKGAHAVLAVMEAVVVLVALENVRVPEALAVQVACVEQLNSNFLLS